MQNIIDPFYNENSLLEQAREIIANEISLRQANDGPILANCEIDLYSPGPETFEWLVDETGDQDIFDF